jgi:hypothetical protein
MPHNRFLSIPAVSPPMVNVVWAVASTVSRVRRHFPIAHNSGPRSKLVKSIMNNRVISLTLIVAAVLP